jgi:MSHA pilin protein MshA
MKQKGFTLIELVVVIVILGILAVTAAPRFLNLQSDARVSALQGLKGAMAGAGSIVYAKSAIEGKESDESGALNTSGITIVYGYPEATSSGIVAAVDGLDSGDWFVEEITADPKQLKATFNTDQTSGSTIGSDCHVLYVEADQVGSYPSISVIENNC